MSSDTWTLGAGLSYKATEHVEFTFAGALGLLTSGKSGEITSNGITYGNDATYRLRQRSGRCAVDVDEGHDSERNPLNDKQSLEVSSPLLK